MSYPGWSDPDQDRSETAVIPAPGPAPGPAPEPAAEPAPEGRSHPVGRLILHVGLAVLVGLGVFAVKSVLFGDKSRNAVVGDCVATGEALGRTDAEVVDCASDEARFTVVGRVNGADGSDSAACEGYFQPAEQFFVYSSDAAGGYLLCLRPTAPRPAG
ncbi:LppU/SCO3897 family protein [Jidongwangia harbinensis]|uniref:LppU/SCO3897 family protein n=1 Tax=Jidongwangia harbinensis TaxID=2878561 RepID=UPI001CD940C7|nr:hypothetical protein [Jidongwangia harbinensis]MCA2215657.1 hypothetical protein [Jidongwangia harbinensis]